MTIGYDVLVPGSSIGLTNGFIGWGMVALVEAGGERILYDCGHAVTRLALRQGLARKGLAPDDISVLFLSHLHFDHALNVDLFPKARVMVSASEWAYAPDPHPDDDFVPGFLPEVLERRGVELFDGEPEIAPGVTALHAPGHTPGLYALAFDHADHGRVVIAGDAIKTARELVEEAVVMEFDAHKRSAATIRMIKARADRIVPGHYAPFRRRADGVFVWDEPAALNLVFR